MAVKIDYTIQSSNFELVRDRIALILKEELDNQALLQGAGDPVVPNDDYTADIYTERFTPVDKSEPNVIIISLGNSSLTNRTPISQINECSFNIDVFTKSKQTSTGYGYYNSAVKLQKLVGLIRHILMSPYYDRLSFFDGIIANRSVNQIQYSEVRDEQDAIYSRMARITFEVHMIENNNQIIPIDASSYQTIIKIEETEKGYLLIKEN
jgi:hypothetical protein